MNPNDREILLDVAGTLERRVSSTRVDVDKLAESIRGVANRGWLTFEELRGKNDQRCRQAFPECDDWTPSDWGTALAGEVGEACNLIKKLRRGDGIDPASIGQELADVVIYADLIASRLGLNLASLIVQKFDEVSDRRSCSIKLAS
jgi:NTP pyrophosphatase (non-canonical NTP hydrolase)